MGIVTWFANRKARAAFERKINIAQMERANGLEVSYPGLDLPMIKVVRNPNGDNYRRWVALGFPGEVTGLSTFENGYLWANTHDNSRSGCLKKARERLWQIALARSEEAVEVSL